MIEILDDIVTYVKNYPVSSILGFGFLLLGGIGSAYYYFNNKKVGKQMLIEDIKRENEEKKIAASSTNPDYNTLDKYVK